MKRKSKLFCDCCRTHKFWAAKKIIGLTLCTDCIGEIAKQAQDLGILGVREILDRENALLSNNGGS